MKEVILKDYQSLIAKLIADPQQQLLVKHEEFGAFHQAWLASPHHDEIVGQALKGGDVIYRYIAQK